MGLFSGVGHALSGVGHAIGSVASNPIVQGLTGISLGPAAAAAMGAAGGALRDGGGIHDAVGGAGSGYVSGQIGKGLALAAGGAGLGAGAAAGAVGGASGAAGAGGGGGIMSHIPSIGSALGFLGGNGGMNGLALAQGLNAAYTGKKAGDYAGDALQSVKDAYDANAPLRDAGRAQMLNPGQGIAAKIAAIPQGPNPYSSTIPQAPQIGPAIRGGV